MKTTNQYIDASKVVTGHASDRAFASSMGWNKSTISAYREGRAFLNNEHASQLADVLRRNPLELIGAAEAERAKSEDKKLYWANFVKKFAGAGVMTMLLLIIAAPMESSHASPSDGSTGFILCKLNGALVVLAGCRRTAVEPSKSASASPQRPRCDLCFAYLT